MTWTAVIQNSTEKESTLPLMFWIMLLILELSQKCILEFWGEASWFWSQVLVHLLYVLSFNSVDKFVYWPKLVRVFQLAVHILHESWDWLFSPIGKKSIWKFLHRGHCSWFDVINIVVYVGEDWDFDTCSLPFRNYLFLESSEYIVLCCEPSEQREIDNVYNKFKEHPQYMLSAWTFRTVFLCNIMADFIAYFSANIRLHLALINRMLYVFWRHLFYTLDVCVQEFHILVDT